MIVTLPFNSATRASRMIRRSHLSRKKNNFTLAFWENQVFLYYLANCGNFGEKIWRFIKPKARYSNSVRIKTKHEKFSSILNLQKENRWLQREFELFCQVFYSKVVWPDTKPLFGCHMKLFKVIRTKNHSREVGIIFLTGKYNLEKFEFLWRPM